MKRLLLPAIALAAICALATTVIPQSIEQLTQQSLLVVAGTAARTWTAWDAEHAKIYTYTEFTIAKTLKGPALPSVLVRQIGGSRDGITLRVAGVRPLVSGEQAVLFLRAGEPDGSGALSITGLMQGHFHYFQSATGVRLSNGLPKLPHRDSVSSYNPREAAVAPYTGGSVSMEEMQSRVQHAMETQPR